MHFNDSCKVRGTKSYLRLIFILFIHISIYLKVCIKKYIKFNETKNQEKTSQGKPTSNIGIQIISFRDTQT